MKRTPELAINEAVKPLPDYEPLFSILDGMRMDRA